jgi:hypothetical protein
VIEDSQPSLSTTNSEMSDTPQDPRQNDPNWKNPYELLEYFLEFVNTNNEILSILGGYFSKFLSCLYQKKKVQLTNYFYSNSNNALENLARHSYNKSISDFLLTVLKGDEKSKSIL